MEGTHRPAGLVDQREQAREATVLGGAERRRAAQGLALDFDAQSIQIVEVVPGQRCHPCAAVAGFVKSAPQFLAKKNIDLDAGCDVFAKYGVPQDVLDQLITVPAKSKGGRTTVDDVVETIGQLRKTFTKQDVIDLTGASPGTTNKALTAAVKAGTITDQGGNPKQYQPM